MNGLNKWEKVRSLWLLIEGTLRGSRNRRASQEAYWIQNGGRVGRREIVLEMEPEGLTNLERAFYPQLGFCYQECWGSVQVKGDFSASLALKASGGSASSLPPLSLVGGVAA